MLFCILYLHNIAKSKNSPLTASVNVMMVQCIYAFTARFGPGHHRVEFRMYLSNSCSKCDLFVSVLTVVAALGVELWSRKGSGDARKGESALEYGEVFQWFRGRRNKKMPSLKHTHC